MKTTMIEIPAALKSAITTLSNLVFAFEHAGFGGRAVDYATTEREVQAATSEIERKSHELMLAELDVDWERIGVDGKQYRNIGRHSADYQTAVGKVRVERSVFRELGVRNGPTVDAVSLRAGVVEDGWLPGAARQMAHMLQRGTPREAETSAREVGRLPYSASSFGRVGHAVGELLVSKAYDIEETLIRETDVPPEVVGLCISLDRASIPVEIPRARKPGRPRSDAPKNPVQRIYRMAYCGTVGLVDTNGKVVDTIRYGRMPEDGAGHEIANSLAGDVHALVAKRPDLDVTTICDGAPELWNLLRPLLNEDTVGRPVYELIDLYHLLEKLHSAAVRVHGEGAARDVLHRWKVRLCNADSAIEKIEEELTTGPCSRTEAVREALTYIANNRDRMRYASARRQGRPLGSGGVEATCKSLIGLRMKRPGARWKPKTADHVIQLRAMALSDRWEAAMRLTLAPLARTVKEAA